MSKIAGELNAEMMNGRETIESLRQQLAEKDAEIERLEEELDDALRGPWAEWAEKSLKIIREHTGYDGYDDPYVVDLPNELAEAFREMEAEIERLKEDGNMPVKYYQPNGKGQIYAVYGASSINFADSLLEQLAASHAREQQLREAATMAEEMIATNAHERRHVRWKLQDALAPPADKVNPRESED